MLKSSQPMYVHGLAGSVACAILFAAAPALAQTDDESLEFETHSRIAVFQPASIASSPIHASAMELQIESLDEFEFSAMSDVLLGAFQDEAAPGSETPPAAPASGSSEHGDLAAQATNPVAPLIQPQFQNSFIGGQSTSSSSRSTTSSGTMQETNGA